MPSKLGDSQQHKRLLQVPEYLLQSLQQPAATAFGELALLPLTVVHLAECFQGHLML
jgi:hypothetical protein